MKKIDRSQVLQAANRKELSSEARAAEVLFATEQWLDAQIGRDFFWQPKTWKNGVLRITVKNPASALRIYAAGEGLLAHLAERFAGYRFREVRTEIVV